MKAVVFEQYGGSDRLQVREIAPPRPGPGEVLIRVRAAGVNPVDWKIRRGDLRRIVRLDLPFTPGFDIAGVVEQVGDGVTRFTPGDEVVAMLGPPRGGGYAELAVAPESATARKPASLDFVETASLPVAAVTALQALRDLGGLPEGGSVLINGASGGVGHFAVMIARALGAGRVAGVCGPENVDYVRDLGADLVIDYKREDFTKRPETYDVILDAAARSSYGACRRVLTPRGVYVSTLPSVGLLLRSALGWVGSQFGGGRRARFVMGQPRAADLETLGRFADEGKLRPTIARVLPLEQAREAHEAIETEHTRGKIVLSVP